jgi:hypothetical protein
VIVVAVAAAHEISKHFDPVVKIQIRDEVIVVVVSTLLIDLEYESSSSLFVEINVNEIHSEVR